MWLFSISSRSKKINEQLKNLHDKLLEIKTLEESNQNNIEIIHEFCSADTSYRIEILNESDRFQFISYLSTSIRLSLELVSLTQTDRQSSKSYQELREELNSIAENTSCYLIKNRLETASEA
ncbi:MAG: hypothetical protein L7U87_02220, partial [Chlamydiales bacterium]|nr:hypothetical protein [Chlamydiales bacterium]